MSQPNDMPQGGRSKLLSLISGHLFIYVLAPLAVVVLSAVLLTAGGLRGDGPREDTLPGPPAETSTVPTTIPVEDVNITADVNPHFVVTIQTFVCGLKRFIDYEAKGQFCVFHVKVANRGKSSGAVPGYWVLYVSDRYFATRALAGPGFGTLFPDESDYGHIVFDIPVQTAPTRVVLGPNNDSPSIPL